jgi:hypothetical protein
MNEAYIEVPKVHWSDIAGSNEMKEKLWEAVNLPLEVRSPLLYEAFDQTVANSVDSIRILSSTIISHRAMVFFFMVLRVAPKLSQLRPWPQNLASTSLPLKVQSLYRSTLVTLSLKSEKSSAKQEQLPLR